MRARVATALVAIPLLVAIITFGHVWYLFSVLVFLTTAVALAEYFRMAFPKNRKERLLGIFMGVVLSMSILVPGLAEPGLFVVPVVLVGFCGYLFSAGELEQRYCHLGWTLLGVFYLGYLFPHIVVTYGTSQGTEWVFFILLVAASGDTAAYFTGMALGKRKLYPEVSPGKTVEGAIGGGVASMIAGFFGAMFLLPALSWLEVVLLAGVVGFLAQIGDLFESWIKRVFGVKDSGRLLPGHGGLLDRIDSIIFPAAFIAYYVKVLHP